MTKGLHKNSLRKEEQNKWIVDDIIETINTEIEWLKKAVDNTPLATEQIAGYLLALVDVQKSISTLQEQFIDWQKVAEAHAKDQPLGQDNDGNLVYLQEQPNNMIQWTGNNLKDVIEFTGKSPRFDEWFKTWDEYESYVHSHGNILKLFNEDGTHLEVPVGAWIFKTPDGQNVPSTFRYQEQPVDLEKEVKKWMYDNCDSNGFFDQIELARHFYNLGRQSECVKVKAESALDKFMFENCTHCSIEHCPGVKACYTSSNKQL